MINHLKEELNKDINKVRKPIQDLDNKDNNMERKIQ
jgi:hypothetical protein